MKQMTISDIAFFPNSILTERQEILLHALLEKFAICLIIFAVATVLKSVIMTLFEILSDFVNLPMPIIRFNMNAIYWISVAGLLIYFVISLNQFINGF